MDLLSQAKMNMIKQQLRTSSIHNERIIDLYHQVPREFFVPERSRAFAYTDQHISLPHNQIMMTPLEEATILQALNLQGSEVILEVGTGTGFLTALLSMLSHRVISIDYYDTFTKQAREKLSLQGCNNVELHTGDAHQGWFNKAPYDVIVFTGALEALSEAHRLQILPGGKLFAILGSAPVMQAMLYELDHEKQWKSTFLYETQVPKLITNTKQPFIF